MASRENFEFGDANTGGVLRVAQIRSLFHTAWAHRDLASRIHVRNARKADKPEPT
jgi:hypothetical protein